MYLKKGVITTWYQVAWHLDMVVKAETECVKQNMFMLSLKKTSALHHPPPKKNPSDVLTPRNLQPCQTWRWAADWPAMFCSYRSCRTRETICWKGERNGPIKTEKHSDPDSFGTGWKQNGESCRKEKCQRDESSKSCLWMKTQTTSVRLCFF